MSRYATVRLYCLSLVAVACGGGGGGTGPGPGPGAAPTITGWTPKQPLLGSPVTIHGTGFSTTLGDDTVMLGLCRIPCSNVGYKMTVTSATATTLVVDLPWDASNLTGPRAANFRVAVGSKSVVASTEATFRWPLTLRPFVNDLDRGRQPVIRPGDLVELSVLGLGAPPQTPVVTVNGIAASPVTMTGIYPDVDGAFVLTFRAPPDAYPGRNPPTTYDDTTSVSIAVTAHGQTVANLYPALRFPAGSTQPISVVVRLSDLLDPNAPASRKEVTVTGSNLVGPIEFVYKDTNTGVEVGRLGTSCATGILCDHATGSFPATTGRFTLTLHSTAFPTAGYPGGLVVVSP